MYSHIPAHEVANDISVTDDNLVAVLSLFGVGAVDVAAESCLDASPVLVVLQEAPNRVRTSLASRSKIGRASCRERV